MSNTKPHLPPSEDSWYTAPRGFETTKPGTILRIRTTPGDLTSTFTNATAVYNILFSTTDSHYRPTWAVTTLFVPKQTDSHALLSYQIPYNSASVNASPSHLVHTIRPDFWGEVLTTIQNALGRGWYINFPDFEGPLASFGDGLTAGHATLDSLRAVLSAGFGLDKDKSSTRVAFWGYSGGALAAAWAAELQAHYAPELPCAGAALGGLAPYLLAPMRNVSGTVFAGLIPQLMLGITAQYPSAREYVVSQLIPDRKDAFLATLDYDIVTAFTSFADQNIFEYFSAGAAILEHPLIHDLFVRRARLGYHGVPRMSVFLYNAIGDEITPIGDTDTLVDRWRESLVNVIYERNTVGNHLAEAQSGRARALKWLGTVLDGTYDRKGCTVRNVTVTAPAAAASSN